MPAPRPMKLSEIQQWIKTNRATVSVGTILLNGTERPAVICADMDRLLAVRPARGGISPGVFEQSWDWGGGMWDTRYIGDLPGYESMSADELHALITGACPRCNGSGVIEDATRYGPFMVPDLLPCPDCAGEVAASQPPLPF